MQYFDTYASNTLAGTSNQYHIRLADPTEVQTSRVYYRIFKGGTYRYSLMYSNITDSTFADGSYSHKNLVCDTWNIHSIRAGVCDTCSILEAPDPAEFIPLTFGGQSQKTVMPGEFFATDSFPITAASGAYLCVEMQFSGKTIPVHEEIQIPAFLKNENGFFRTGKIPVPGMVGCDRQVPLKIAFLGDSITQGIGTTQNGYLHWNAVAADTLGDTYSYWNLGIGYARANDAATDGAWLFKVKQNDLVVVCMGVNDLLQGFSAESIKNDLTTIVDKLKEAGCRVILQTVPPFSYSGDRIGKWFEVNEYIKNALSGKADGIFDCVPLLYESAEAPYMAGYGSHPGDEGCAVWGKAIGEYLRDFLAADQV